MNKNYFIINKKRFRVFIFLLLIIYSFAMIIILGIITNNYTNKENSINKKYNYESETINKGDTIWTLVTKHNNFDNVDIRKLVYETKMINDLNGEIIKEGDLLLIPKTK